MDFLEIRRKAKQRAARERGAGAPEASPEPDLPPASSHPPGDPAAHGRAGPDPEPQPASDARFTTWRPGVGERPLVAPPETPPPPKPAPSDFAVYSPAPPREEAASAPPAPSAPSARDGAPAPPPGGATPAPSGPLAPEPPGREAAPRSQGARGPEPSRVRTPGGGESDPLEEFFFRPDEEAPVTLGLLPAAGEPEAAAREDTEIEEYLTFQLGAEEYGIPIEQVHEVLKAPAITEVPRAPPGILGVVTVRGEVVAVFDPRLRLRLPGTPPGDGEGRIVIVDDGGGACGLLVDGVAGVVRLARRSVEPCPQGIGGASADCLAGIGRERGRLFTVLDLPALLRRAPGLSPRGGSISGGGVER